MVLGPSAPGGKGNTSITHALLLQWRVKAGQPVHLTSLVSLAASFPASRCVPGYLMTHPHGPHVDHVNLLTAIMKMSDKLADQFLHDSARLVR